MKKKENNIDEKGNIFGIISLIFFILTIVSLIILYCAGHDFFSNYNQLIFVGMCFVMQALSIVSCLAMIFGIDKYPKNKYLKIAKTLIIIAVIINVIVVAWWFISFITSDRPFMG